MNHQSDKTLRPDRTGPPLAPQTLGARLRLRIMATSDLHMHLAAYDYFLDSSCTDKGLALTARLIARARAENPDALLFDNGDFLQGSPLGDYSVQSPDQSNPAIMAMNHLGYDVVNIGNHEFSFGIAHLRNALTQAKFPCVAANSHLVGPGDARVPFLPPATILTRDLPDETGARHSVRIGVIGVAPPQTTVWEQQALNGGLVMTDMVDAVARQIPHLRSQGADVVIVLAHSGIGAANPGPMAENASLAIAALPGVDAMVMGHVHLPFPGPQTGVTAGVDPVAGTLMGKPAVMPGVFGSHLGVIDLDLQTIGTGTQITAHRAEARPIRPGTAAPLPQADAGLTALITPAHDATVAWARRPVGRTPCAIHSYFAMVAPSLALDVVMQAQAQHVARRLAGGPHADLPLLSATAPFKAGGRSGPGHYTFIPPGALLRRHAADLYMHPNTIVALRLSGACLRHWLNQSTRVFNRLTPGQSDQMLLDPGIASFHFDVISGVTYRIDLCADPASGARICDLARHGVPVADDDMFILATNNYRSSGSGGFLATTPPEIVLADQIASRDILTAYLASDAHLNARAAHCPTLPPEWTFIPCPGTSALFDTAPQSAGFLTDVSHLALTPLGLTDLGFERYRLRL